MVQLSKTLPFQLGYGIIRTLIHTSKNITKTGDTYPINLVFNDTTFRVTVTLAENYQLDLRASDFNELIGFDKKDISKWNAYWIQSAKSQSRHRHTQCSLRFGKRKFS